MYGRRQDLSLQISLRTAHCANHIDSWCHCEWADCCVQISARPIFNAPMKENSLRAAAESCYRRCLGITLHFEIGVEEHLLRRLDVFFFWPQKEMINSILWLRLFELLFFLLNCVGWQMFECWRSVFGKRQCFSSICLLLWWWASAACDSCNRIKIYTAMIRCYHKNRLTKVKDLSLSWFVLKIKERFSSLLFVIHKRCHTEFTWRSRACSQDVMAWVISAADGGSSSCLLRVGIFLRFVLFKVQTIWDGWQWKSISCVDIICLIRRFSESISSLANFASKSGNRRRFVPHPVWLCCERIMALLTI